MSGAENVRLCINTPLSPEAMAQKMFRLRLVTPAAKMRSRGCTTAGKAWRQWHRNQEHARRQVRKHHRFQQAESLCEPCGSEVRRRIQQMNHKEKTPKLR